MDRAGERDGGIATCTYTVKEDAYMRPLPRRRRRAEKQTEEVPAPLARLKRRCVVGLCIAVAAFIAAFVADVAWNAPGSSAVTIGVEVGAASAGTLCAFIATAVWMMTQNTEYAMLIWNIAARGYTIADVGDNAEAPFGADATPIGYGHTVRNRRRGSRIAG